MFICSSISMKVKINLIGFKFLFLKNACLMILTIPWYALGIMFKCQITCCPVVFVRLGLMEGTRKQKRADRPLQVDSPSVRITEGLQSLHGRADSGPVVWGAWVPSPRRSCLRSPSGRCHSKRCGDPLTRSSRNPAAHRCHNDASFPVQHFAFHLRLLSH